MSYSIVEVTYPMKLRAMVEENEDGGRWQRKDENASWGLHSRRVDDFQSPAEYMEGRSHAIPSYHRQCNPRR